MMRADKVMRLFFQSSHFDSDRLVVTQFIETMDLLRVQGPKATSKR
jgi:glycine cleavage system aminomethyltransferase T